MSTLHPRGRIHVVHVMPDHGAFESIYADYTIAAQSHAWLSLLTPIEFEQWWPRIRLDAHVVVVLWAGRDDIGPRNERRCRVLEVYSEAFGPDWLPEHAVHFDRFRARADQLDTFAVHTPRVAKYLYDAFGFDPILLPVGWVPRAAPTGERSGVLYFGSNAGKRAWSAPAILGAAEHVRDVSGAFGAELRGRLEHAHAAVTLHHSDVWTTSTWRLWQIAGTGAAAIFEVGSDDTVDLWPLLPTDEAVATVPRIAPENVRLVAREIDRLAESGTLPALAARLTERLRPWTIERCHEALVERMRLG